MERPQELIFKSAVKSELESDSVDFFIIPVIFIKHALHQWNNPYGECFLECHPQFFYAWVTGLAEIAIFVRG